MPEASQAPQINQATEQVQPWRAVWPAPMSAPSAEETLKIWAKRGGNALNGVYGYNDQGKGVPPAK
jgi:hypothetical protein